MGSHDTNSGFEYSIFIHLTVKIEKLIFEKEILLLTDGKFLEILQQKYLENFQVSNRVGQYFKYVGTCLVFQVQSTGNTLKVVYLQ